MDERVFAGPMFRPEKTGQDLLQQCDHKLMLGGFGVAGCGKCQYAPAPRFRNRLEGGKPLVGWWNHVGVAQIRFSAEKYWMPNSNASEHSETLMLIIP